MSRWRNLSLDARRAAAVSIAILHLLLLTGWDFVFHRGEIIARLGPRLRVRLEHLGAAFVKFGQFLAARFDLLPPEICRNLDQLFENVRQIPFQEVRRVVEEELQAPVAELFSQFEPRPIAAASIAQVHEGRTANGDRVAVKIQRPGVAEVLYADLRIMRLIARVADRVQAFGAISLTEIVYQFAMYTERELDFVTEGQTADILRKNAANHEIIPKIFWELTTSRVLTMEFIDGVSLADVVERMRAGDLDSIFRRLPNLSLERVLHDLAFASLHQLFVTGYFHGDPHPGNILICSDNRVALIDFGISGELRERERLLLRRYLGFLALGDFEESYRNYSRLFQPTEETDVAEFKRQTLEMMRQWYLLSKDESVPAGMRLAGRFSDKMSTLVRKNRLRMSMDTLLFWRVLIILDSTALRFTTRFDLLDELRAFFRKIQIEELMSALKPPSPVLVAEGTIHAYNALQRAAHPSQWRVVTDSPAGAKVQENRSARRQLGALVLSSALVGLSVLARSAAAPAVASVILVVLVACWIAADWRGRRR
jgi:ubiquinone biosynthesis protein